MNYMGTDNIDMMNTSQNDAYQPAARQLTPEQRMYIKNHPDMSVTWGNNYQHGCMNNSGTNMNNGMANHSMNGSMINSSQNNWSSNNSMAHNQNSMMTTASSKNTISLRPETMTNTDFLPAYLSQFIGKWVRCEFFIGDTVEQRVGVLHDVGASYIIIDVIEPQTLVVCDIFSLRFVTIVLDEEYGRLLKV